MLNLSGIVTDSIVDGPGIRVCIFCQGCPHHCPGCHNPETWDFQTNALMEQETLLEIIRSNPLCRGVTFSGGEPFAQAAAFAERETYSSYTYVKMMGFLRAKALKQGCQGQRP